MNNKKFMIIGSCNDDNKEEFSVTCEIIAEELLKLSATLIICSIFKDSADYYVCKKFSQESDKIEFHGLNVKDVRDRLNSDPLGNKLKKIMYLDDSNELSKKDQYLFCQLFAMRQADYIIAIGGKIGGSASMLLNIAETEQKTVIPLLKYEGAAKMYYEKCRYRIKDIVNDDISCLESDEIGNVLKLFCENGKIKRVKVISQRRVFISYPRDNASWADCIELFLRRRNIELFRDESEFKAGSNIPNIIKEQLYKANTFIAIWCKEYACSPWCFDEIDLALKRLAEGDNIELWIFCVDDTRIVHPKARNLLNYRVHTREELEGIISRLL